jgi:hypothetical protein
VIDADRPAAWEGHLHSCSCGRLQLSTDRGEARVGVSFNWPESRRVVTCETDGRVQHGGGGGAGS